MKSRSALPSNQEKQAVWDAYRRRQPTRVHVLLATNPRIILLDPALNREGYTFEQYFQDPRVMLTVQLKHALHRAEVINRYTDDSVGDQEGGYPDVWRVGVDRQNIY